MLWLSEARVVCKVREVLLWLSEARMVCKVRLRTLLWLSEARNVFAKPRLSKATASGIW